MKYCRFVFPGSQTPRLGIIENQQIVELASEDLFSSDVSTVGAAISLNEVKLLPLVSPSKIVCVGRNYAEHARELGNEVPKEPLLFLKAPSSLITNDEPILLPPSSAQVEHEGELAVVIKKSAKNLANEENPLDYVFAYTCLNDVTARDLQRQDVQFTRAKSFDTFCPVLNYLETELDPQNLAVSVRVNGILKQHGNTAQMIFSVAELVRYISLQMTLLPGDLIATGTPAGVSKLNPGDVCEVEIENLGVLRNPVEPAMV